MSAMLQLRVELGQNGAALTVKYSKPKPLRWRRTTTKMELTYMEDLFLVRKIFDDRAELRSRIVKTL